MAAQALAEERAKLGSMRRRIAGQGALLVSGFALGQAFSLVRNSVLGYWLSRGDFGIAATITLALQLLETLSDLGADRLVVQADDADAPGVMAASHATMLVRGTLTSAVLYLGAGLATDFFNVAHARAAFEIAALVPLLKAFMHLEPRRRQRALDNRASLAVEIVPQAAALVLTVPMLAFHPSYVVVVWLGLAQAVLGVLTSHGLARTPYEVSFARAGLGRIAAFGWPIWLSAFPLLAVYQGDRLLIGRFYGMEALAGYSAAFMITMVPGLLAAKVGNALLLPLLADARSDAKLFAGRYRLMSEATVLVAAAYLAGFLLVGGALAPKVFGPNYSGLGPIVTWLAVMWALRMVQAVPGMALMAVGDTRPLLAAGIIRASALLLAIEAARSGFGLSGIAAAGSAGELASLVYVAARTAHHWPGLAAMLLKRVLFLLPAGCLAGSVAWQLGPEAGLMPDVAAAMLVAAVLTLAGIGLMPGLRALAKDPSFGPRQRPAAWTAPPVPATDAPQP